MRRALFIIGAGIAAGTLVYLLVVLVTLLNHVVPFWQWVALCAGFTILAFIYDSQ